MLSLSEIAEYEQRYEMDYISLVNRSPNITQNELSKAALLYSYTSALYDWVEDHHKDTTSIAYNEFIEAQAGRQKEIEKLGGTIPSELIPDEPSENSKAAYQAHKLGLISVNPKYAEQHPDEVIKMGRNYYRKKTEAK
jgi:hypothetical protein